MTPVTSPSGGRVRVVVADDHLDFRDILRRVLERDGGFEVVAEAADGDAAIAAVDTHRPDILLLDLSMPGRGGPAVVPVVRQRCPETRIIVLSGWAADTREPIGADAELEKTAGLERIVSVIGAVLRAVQPTAAPSPMTAER